MLNRDEAIEFIVANSYGDLSTEEAPLFSYVSWIEKPNIAVQLFPTGKPHQYTYGWAKVNWPDEWDYVYGLELALRKAAAKLVKTIGVYQLDHLLTVQTLTKEKEALTEQSDVAINVESDDSPKRFYPTPFIIKK